MLILFGLIELDGGCDDNGVVIAELAPDVIAVLDSVENAVVVIIVEDERLLCLLVVDGVITLVTVVTDGVVPPLVVGVTALKDVVELLAIALLVLPLTGVVVDVTTAIEVYTVLNCNKCVDVLIVVRRVDKIVEGVGVWLIVE